MRLVSSTVCAFFTCIGRAHTHCSTHISQNCHADQSFISVMSDKHLSNHSASVFVFILFDIVCFFFTEVILTITYRGVFSTFTIYDIELLLQRQILEPIQFRNVAIRNIYYTHKMDIMKRAFLK